MSIAAFAVAESAVAEAASKSMRETPPKRLVTAKRDPAPAAEPR